MYMCIYIYMHAYIHTYIHIHTIVRTCAQRVLCIHVYARYTCVCMHTLRIDAAVHTYTRMSVQPLASVHGEWRGTDSLWIRSHSINNIFGVFTTLITRSIAISISSFIRSRSD